MHIASKSSGETAPQQGSDIGEPQQPSWLPWHWLLDQTGRDFTPMFALVVVVELAGLVAWNAWWSSKRTFD